MRTETATKKITQSGDSLVINVTKEAHRLGLARGDDVAVTLAPVSDDLDFISRCMTNAIIGQDLERDDAGLIRGADRATVERIYMAVAECSPPNLIIGMDPTNADYVTIDIFTLDNDLLTGWVFILNKD